MRHACWITQHICNFRQSGIHRQRSPANESNLVLSGNVNQLDTQSINDVFFA